jgi:hypothetical protein
MAKQGRRTTSGLRLNLDEPLKSEFADYLSAKDDASQKTVVERAIRGYMQADLDQNQGLRARYEELRRLRREGSAGNVRLIKQPEKAC